MIIRLLKKILSGLSRDTVPNETSKTQRKKRNIEDTLGKKSKKRNSEKKQGCLREQTDKKKTIAKVCRKENCNKQEAIVLERPEKLNDVEKCDGKMRFLDLPLKEEIQFGIQHAGFDYCTNIQALTLPHLLDGRDLAGKAQTGTGKTAAFLLMAFDKLLKKPIEQTNASPRVLILAPTRELAIQIHKDAVNLGCFTGLNSVVVFGGMDYAKQRSELDAKIDLLIGTPGRIIDYLRNGFLKLDQVEILVIDEADRMLDMGFIPDVKRIVYHLPPREKRQTLLFSATLDQKILQLASGWLADPVVMESEPEQMISDNIKQVFYSVLRDDKLALLLYLLKNTQYNRVLIFGNRKDVNLRLQADLVKYGYNVPVLSGDISQDKRIKILERFRRAEEKIVIATDVAARGIHVDDVSLVINYDLPERAEDYIHRVGRTGRAGHEGLSISFLCEYGAYYLPDIENLLNVKFSSMQPTEEMLKLPEPLPKALWQNEFKLRKSTTRRHSGSFRAHR